MKRDPYPLQWPDGWKRTPDFKRAKPQFLDRFAQDRDSVLRQLRRRGANIVITSDLPTRGDGLPYAKATCSDPGIAVWWIEQNRERVMACDRWKTIGQNLRALDMSIEAMRGLDRWGASDVVERAFAGFTALPPGAPEVLPTGPDPWRQVLGGDWPLLGREDLLALAKARHRRLIADAHPDRGGSHELAAILNHALDQAQQELAP